MMGIKQQWLVDTYMQWLRATAWQNLARAAASPAATQQDMLLRTLKHQRATSIGQQYRFGALDTVDAYRNAVPIHDYEGFRPAIEKQAETGEQTLTMEMPIHYLLTSGTTGKPKAVPLTQPTKCELRKCQQLASYGLYQQTRALFSGRMLAIAADATEGLMPNGTPYGSMSGVLQDSMSCFMYRRSVLANPADSLNRYESIGRRAVNVSNFSVALTANPSNLLRLKEVMVEKELIAASTTLGSLWPSMQAIITWTHGNCAHYLPALHREFPNTSILEMGYIASEFYGTIPVGNGQCVPALSYYFFEFAEIEQWDNGNHSTLLLHELEQHKHYYVIVTSSNGLYRYFIDDIVEVTGWFKQTPCLRFVQKGKDVTSLTGEKLYEKQLILAMESVFTPQGTPSFFLALAHAEPAQYTLYVEGGTCSAATAQQLDAALANINIEYNAKRSSGRIAPLKMLPLKTGAGAAYRAHIAASQREAQLKLRRLAYAADCQFDFAPFLVEVA